MPDVPFRIDQPRTFAGNVAKDKQAVVTDHKLGRVRAELQAKGWLVATKIWRKGFDGKGRTTNWRLTMLPSGAKRPSEPPTREPERWSEGNDYPVEVYPNYLPKPRKGRIENITLSPNRARYRARIGCDDPIDLPENVVPVRPNRAHGRTS